MAETIIQSKSFSFAVRIVKLYKYLCEEKQEYVLSKQLLRSGTSIGANVREAKRAQSMPDFGMKLSISLKEAEESLYWIELLKATDYLTDEQYNSMYGDCEELVKLLSAATKKVYSKD
jgi:four helix bundle protein